MNASHTRWASRLSGVALVACLGIAFASPAWADRVAAGPSLTQGHEAVEASMQMLRDKWKGVKVVAKITPMGGRSAKVLEVQSSDDHLFIVRRPRREVEHGLRVNVAQQRLAAAMGEERLVPPAVIDTTPVQLDADSASLSKVLVVKHVGRAYVNANKMQPALLARVPERAKLVSAIIDLLAEQQDRKSENILVKKDGSTIKMIDPDKSFGQRSGRKYRSQFFHGGMVGYTSQQNRFEDLPADLQTFIGDLALASVEHIQKVYGLAPEEAQVVSNQAGRIRAVGLRQAIDEYVTSLGPLHAAE